MSRPPQPRLVLARENAGQLIYAARKPVFSTANTYTGLCIVSFMPFGTVTNGMKLTGMWVSVEAVVVARLLEQAVFFGSAFSASGFEAIRAMGHGIGGDPRQQLAP